MIRIIDLDNTISDDEWRLEYIKEKAGNPDEMYDLYHSLCTWDLPYHKKLYEGRDDIAIFTSRPEKFEERTQRWLARWGISWAQLFMRPEGNLQSSPVLKMSFFYQLMAIEKYVPMRDFEIFDDRLDVIKLFKMKGINANLKQINKRKEKV